MTSLTFCPFHSAGLTRSGCMGPRFAFQLESPACKSRGLTFQGHAPTDQKRDRTPLTEELIGAMCWHVQGYSIGQHDVLFATNVLHATHDMGSTLQHCKALLRKGGLLIANELSAKTEFLTLTFGLTEGWWLYDDVRRRIPGSTLLSRQAGRLHPSTPGHPSPHAYQGTAMQAPC